MLTGSTALAVERDALKAENDRLRAALEPFRKVAEEHDVWDADRDDSPMLIEHCEGGREYDITLGDLRRVRETLSQSK